MKSNVRTATKSLVKTAKSNLNGKHSVGKTVAGGATGVVVGAMVGGPVGAIVGGMVGSAIGSVAGRAGSPAKGSAPSPKRKTASRSKPVLKKAALNGHSKNHSAKAAKAGSKSSVTKKSPRLAKGLKRVPAGKSTKKKVTPVTR